MSAFRIVRLSGWRPGWVERFSHVRRVKLQAQKILCLIFSGRSAWPPLAGQEARSSKRRLIKL
jgi:hypothetical protein